jgi:hypothetical protein
MWLPCRTHVRTRVLPPDPSCEMFRSFVPSFTLCRYTIIEHGTEVSHLERPASSKLLTILPAIVVGDYLYIDGGELTTVGSSWVILDVY